jgi:hypothetical protein
VSTISRKYDFQAGQKIQSAQVDEELNQLVDGHNGHEERILAVEAGGTQFYSKSEINDMFVAAEFGTPPVGGVNTAYLTDGAVTTPKLADSGVTTAKMAAGSVTHDRLSGSEQTASVGGTLYAYTNLGGW